MVTAIILAGGKGTRMAASKSKQYIELEGKPILYYSIKHFIDNNFIDNIILVVREDEIDYCKEEVLKKYNLKINKIVSGGRERQESVYNGLVAANGSDIVLIHDAVRPFVSKRIIDDSIKYAKKYKASAPGVMPKDTIKIKNERNFSIETPERNKLILVQTPQAFEYDMILECHRKIKEMGICVTDDTMVVELFGNDVYIFDGEYTNIKITTPEDMALAKYLVNI